MLWKGVLASFLHFIMFKECSSGVGTPDFSTMKGRHLTFAKRRLGIKKWICAICFCGKLRKFFERHFLLYVIENTALQSWGKVACQMLKNKLNAMSFV